MSASSTAAAARRTAEALMVDTCRVTRTTQAAAINEATGQFSDTTVTVYVGRCRVQVRGAVSAASSVVAVAGLSTTADLVEVHIPVSAAGPVPGDDVTVTRSVDPAAQGRTFTVSSVPTKTYASARRLLCGDART